jgi:hypothetical protein
MRRLVFVMAVAAACSSSTTPAPAPAPLVIPDGCQPLLGGVECTLPYPSDFFRTADASTPTGFRLVLSGAAQPKTWDGKNADVSGGAILDGASRVSPMMAALPSTDLVRDGLPSVLDDGTLSSSPASPSIVLETSTGKLVQHYTDIATRGNDALGPAISLRTFYPLEYRTRYIVALRNVKTSSGANATPAEGFRRLRDKIADPALDAVRGRFESDVFAPLAKAGIDRSTLQIAWDFTTGSEEAPRADMLRVRDLAQGWLAQNVPQVTVTSVDVGTSPLWKTIRGAVTGPLYLESTGPLAKLARDDNKLVKENGTCTFPFLVTIPESVRDQQLPGRAVALGHGFFGTRDELIGGGTPTIAQSLHAVMFAIDWWGMSAPDRDDVAAAILQDASRAADFADRVHQAMANWMVMSNAIKNVIWKDPAFDRPMTTAKLYDPSEVVYFGASNGHILGGVQTALNPDFQKIVLNVGGAGWTHIAPRSLDFSPFNFLIDSATRDPVHTQAVQVLLQGPLDRIDPETYASLLAKKTVLMQIGLGDAEVPNCGSFLHARMLGLKQTAPGQPNILGIPEADPTTLTSGMTIFDFGIDTSKYIDPAPLAKNQVHEGVRIDPQALAQMDAFYRGSVIHPCPSRCVAK